MSTPRRNDDPPDEGGVYEFRRGETWFAYTEDDEVFAYVPNESDRDDGYVLIGTYAPTDEHYEGHLYEIAGDWLRLREQNRGKE